MAYDARFGDEFWARPPETPSQRSRVPSQPLPRRASRSGEVPRPAFPPPPGPIGHVADYFRAHRGDPRVGVAALILVAVVAGLVWYRVGVGGATAPPRHDHHRTERPSTPSSVAPDASGNSPRPTADDADGTLVVHVAGAVTKPGVVELPAGTRVIDAVEAVGGALPEGQLDRLNLAAKLADGQRVFVARPGEADPGAGTGASVAGAPTGAPTGGSSDGVAGGPVNLNTATQAELEELPGIGPVLASAILTERDRRGGFRSVNELRSVRGIGEQRFADLAPLVAV